ncbi:LamG domain-containing protein [Actinoplanes sp. GCM10030250]|uniref:LamG domain-containing protein n=1 Tax=Actinoplanes sp. GCM10030250 TaxID=3273376 RepID=UPI00360FF612
MAGRGSTLRGFVSAAVLAACGMIALPAAAAAAAPPSSSPTAEDTALDAAAQTGVPVVVHGSQTETSRAFATPAGKLVLESYAEPRWTGDSAGGWRQIDRRLRLENGVVTPVATLAATTFSAGGTQPMATLPVAGGSVAFSWPGTLPAPRLENDTAVYESVLDDVDLRVRALSDGFTWSLVVNTREAAQNPELDELRFKVAASGVSVAGKAGGGFAVRDRAGRNVASADGAVMWDAKGTAPAVRASARTLSEELPEKANRAELATGIENDELVIVPDTEVLRGRNAVYPVVIDPWTTINKIRWGYANETNANRNDGVARAGRDPDGSGIARPFFAFNLASLAGKQIRSAKFLTTMTHSWSCTATPVSLFRSADLATAGRQAWDGPDLQLFIQTMSGNAHKPSTGAGCGNDPQPNKPLEYTAAALRTDVDAAKGQTNYTLALAAGETGNRVGEGDSKNWKKFDPALTKLSIEYNTPPNTPSAGQLTLTADYTAPAQACVTGTNRPILRSSSPWLKAVLTDPDGTNGGTLSGQFTLQKYDGSTWATVSGWPRTKSGVAPSAKAEVQITSGIANGDRLRWQVRASDTLGGSSNQSAYCEFDVDTTGPTAKPSVATADNLYPEATPDDVVHGNMGRSGQFTFGPNGQADVASYAYQLNAGPVMTATPATAGGSVTIWVTPNRLAENVLTVRAKDQAGNASGPYDYRFLVNEGNAPAAVWGLDEGSGSTAQTTPTGGPSLALANNPGWTDDRIVGTHSATGVQKALTFNGTTQSASSAAPVLNTSRTFTVATWVKLSNTTGFQTLLSQSGTSSSAFYLQTTPSTGVNRYRFVRHTADGGTYSQAAATGTSAPLVGVWTHVAGTYDAGTQELRLYVNGKLEGTAAYNPAQAWNATGPMHVGQARTAGVLGNFVGGTFGEVRVWDRAIDPVIDLRPLTEPVQVGQWEMDDLDDDAPREVTDGSGYDRPLTLTQTTHATQPTQLATQWGEGYNFSNGLVFDGVTGAAATAGRVVRTDQSFSVTAWVRRDSNTGNQTVWGQDGTVNSSAYLRYQDNFTGGAWVFGMRTTDDTAGSQMAAFITGATSAWTHLAATYDATAGVMRLYVNGVLANTANYRPAWDSTGGFTVGRGKYLSGSNTYWKGAIDRVRVWQGTLAAEDITALFNEP